MKKPVQMVKPTFDASEALLFGAGDAKKENQGEAKGKAANASKAVSGLVPDGDVRLTSNIRQDLHLKLKIEAAKRRTTIGEIIEELIESHL